MSEAETVEALGELAVLARIFPRLPAADAALLGPGDDAAVLAAPDARYVVTTDLMVEGPDFRWEWSSPEDLGWKAAATNLSDIAAMGARPTALVVALAAPPSTSVAVLEGIADGLRLACVALAPGCGVVGGDLSASGTFTIAVTAFGDLGGRPPVLRSGARPGDVVAVAGELGLAGRGLRALFSLGLPGARDSDRLGVSRQLRPVPPVALGPVAAAAGATAMLDLSDGLALDARRVAVASGVVIDLVSSALASEQAEDDEEAALRDALFGGEDHALLATFAAGAALPAGFREIGTVRAADSAPELRLNGIPVTDRGGWDPYTDWRR